MQRDYDPTQVARLTAALLICVASVVGGMAAAPSADADVSVSYANPCAVPAKFKGQQRGTYDLSCGLCWNSGWVETASDYGIRSRDPALVARRYAEKSILAGSPNRPAAHAGCLRGFGNRLAELCIKRKNIVYNTKVRFQDRTYWCSPE